MNENKKKTLFKILGIALLVVGVIFLVITFIDFIKVVAYNNDLLVGETPKTSNILYPVLSSPFLFAGFFFVILGFGRKVKEHA